MNHRDPIIASRSRRMPFWENYHVATSLQDALTTAAHAPGTARFVAGGTDLLLDIQQGRHPPVHTLVDVTALPETQSLEIRPNPPFDDELFVGAAVPLSRIVTSLLVIHHAQALSEAAALIGGSQVRNTATLGGNVGHALPAADGAIALLALDAQAEIAEVDVPINRRIPLIELFAGPGRSTLDLRTQMLVGFYVAARRGPQGSAHRRVMRPQGVAIAIMNMGVWLEREGECIRDIRVALGPAGPIPVRAKNTEAFLRGKAYSPDLAAHAVDVLLDETHFRTSPHRSTAAYRRNLAPVLLHDALSAAWERAM
jgi:carbon-monoxide dehydrogenase medium subunit